jgi:hypothetical protein
MCLCGLIGVFAFTYRVVRSAEVKGECLKYNYEFALR